MYSAVRIAAFAAFVSGLLPAQPKPALFDSASIKPAATGIHGFSIRPLPGRFSAQNVTLRQLIGAAWHLPDYQVSGGPKWIDADRFDLEAKAPEAATPPTDKELMVMLQGLLAERFGLAVRHDTRDLPIYSLEPAKGGPKLGPTADPAAAVQFRVLQRHQITAVNAPLKDLTETLSWVLGRRVFDRTGLTGAFDYKLEWAPDDLQLRSDESPVANNGTLPSLGAALKETLGLKLTSQKGPVEMLAIEKAEKLTGN